MVLNNVYTAYLHYLAVDYISMDMYVEEICREAIALDTDMTFPFHLLQQQLLLRTYGETPRCVLCGATRSCKL